MDHLLSIVLFTPLVGLLVLLFIPSSNARAIKLWANAIALAGFLVSVPLVLQFNPGKDFQFFELTNTPFYHMTTSRVMNRGCCRVLKYRQSKTGPILAFAMSWSRTARTPSARRSGAPPRR